MEVVALVFGLIAFVLALQAQDDIKKLKNRIARLENKKKEN